MRLRTLAANLTELEVGDYRVLFSYETPVAFCEIGEGFYRTDKTFTRTTARHITTWLDGREAVVVPHKMIEDLFRAGRVVDTSDIRAAREGPEVWSVKASELNPKSLRAEDNRISRNKSIENVAIARRLAELEDED